MKVLILILGLITSFAYAQSKAGFYVVGGKIITVQDTSSQKYLKAIEGAGNTNTILQNFVSNFLVTTERAIGSYSLMKAQYPFIGGTAATHKFNLNDPRDLDAAFRLTFTGGITHSASGIRGDGSTGYADTKLKLATNISSTGLVSMGFYTSSSTTASSLPFDMGAYNNAGVGVLETYSVISIRPTSQFYISNYAGINGQLYPSISLVKGNYQLTQDGIAIKGFVNGLKITTPTNFITSEIVNSNYYLMATNTLTSPSSQAALGFSDKTYGLFYFSSPLTDTQSIQQSKIVTAFNGFLSRQ